MSAVDSRTWVLAASILGAGVAVGLGLYFGLSARGNPPPVESRAPEAVVPTPPQPTARSPRVASATLRAETAERAKQALSAQRSALTAACWAPSAARNPTPQSVEFALRFGFDTTGKRVFHAVDEPHDGARADVAQCLRERAFDLRIPPPELPVAVEVPLTLP